jgi:hypothetical protein
MNPISPEQGTSKKKNSFRILMSILAKEKVAWQAGLFMDCMSEI